MVNEQALRRDGFRPGIPIRLADGQCWHFPVPRDAAALDPDSAALLDAVTEAEDDAERHRAELALALHLFSRNYALDPQGYQALFRFSPDGAELTESKRAFRALAEACAHRLPPRDEDAFEPDAARPSRLSGWIEALARCAARGRAGNRRNEPVGLLRGDPRP